MLWFLIVVGFGGVIGTLSIICHNFKYEQENHMRNTLISLIFCVIFLIIAIIAILGIVSINSMTYEEVLQTDNLELVSLADNSQISGKGSLFYISIDTNEVYSFYYKVDDTSFKSGKVKSDITTIYEMDDCIPHIEEYTTYLRNKLDDKMMLFLLISRSSIYQETSYKIYVPKGTILRTFNLDSQ